MSCEDAVNKSDCRKCVDSQNFEAAKENMTAGQLGDERKIRGGQPLRIAGGKNMAACHQF